MAEKKDKAAKVADSGQTLEQSMQELADIVATMEKGGLPLEETFRLYKEGMELLKKCRGAIDMVEKELEILENSGDDDEHSES